MREGLVGGAATGAHIFKKSEPRERINSKCKAGTYTFFVWHSPQLPELYIRLATGFTQHNQLVL